MKINISKVCAGLLVAVVGMISLPIHAEDAPPYGSGECPTSGQHSYLSFLTQIQRDQLKTARDTALAGSSDLNAQEEAFKVQSKALRDNVSATDADRSAFWAANKPFQTTLRIAELKVDPTLQPVFNAIDKHFQDKLESAM